MRNYTEHTYLEQRTIQALTHVKCDKCGKEIGTFNLDNLECNGDIKYTGYGDDKAPHPKVWYLCRRIQNAPYDMNRGYHSKDFDICPDCFVSFMNEFKEFCGNDKEMKIRIEIDLNKDQALDALLEILDMEWIHDDGRFEIKNGKVYKNGKHYDDRADLFAALRNVENALYPNLEYRSDTYITHYDENDEE